MKFENLCEGILNEGYENNKLKGAGFKYQLISKTGKSAKTKIHFGSEINTGRADFGWVHPKNSKYSISIFTDPYASTIIVLNNIENGIKSIENVTINTKSNTYFKRFDKTLDKFIKKINNK